MLNAKDSIQHISLDRYAEEGPTYWAVVVGDQVSTGMADSDFEAVVAALKTAGLPLLGNVVEGNP